MNLLQRSNLSHLFAAAALLAGAACGDRASILSPRAATGKPSAVISDGAHGGNDDVFFLPPMADNPNHKPGYGDPFDAGLPVYYRIRDITQASHPVIKTLAANASRADQQYQANWDTKSPALNTEHTYRIEVWIDSRPVADVLAGLPAHCTLHPESFSCSPIAFADVDVVANASQLKSVNTNEYIGLQDGKTLPLKVRIEKGWACANNASCVAQVVPNVIPEGQHVIVTSNDQLNALSLEGNWTGGDTPVVVTIENVAGQIPGGCGQAVTPPITSLTSPSCIHITTDPPVTLATPAKIQFCVANPGDHRQLVVKFDQGEKPQFLDDITPLIPCPEFIGFVPHSNNRLVNLAALAMNRVSRAVRWATGVKPAYAIDLGVGGLLEIESDFSWFTLASPFEITATGGENQTAALNTVLANPLTVKLQALHRHGDPLPAEFFTPSDLPGLEVTCTVGAGSGALVVGETNVSSALADWDADNSRFVCKPWQMPGTAQSTNTVVVSTNKEEAEFYYPTDNPESPYVLKSGTLTFHATSKHATTTVVTCPLAVIFTGSPQTPCTVTVSGGGLDLHPAPTYLANTAVGTATASYTYAGDATHLASNGSATFVIDPGQLYGTNGNASAGANLLQINSATGAGTVIGAFGAFVMPGIAWDASTSTLFGGRGAGTPYIYTINKVTGSATFRGNSGLGFAAVSALTVRSSDGTLFASVNIAGDGGTGADHLAIINKTTGVATLVGPYGSCTSIVVPSVGGGTCTNQGIEGIAFAPNGTLYGVHSTRGASGSPGLYTINTTTGAATFLGPILDGSGNNSLLNFVSLAISPSGAAFMGTGRTSSAATDGGQLTSLNLTTHIFTLIGQTTAGGTGLSGLTIAP